MTPSSDDALKLVQRTTGAQGLPEQVVDPIVIARVASALTTSGRPAPVTDQRRAS